MTTEEAIKLAITYEIKVRDVYRGACERATNDVGKRVFEVLRDEEQEHVDFLQRKLDEWKKTGKASVEGIKSAIPSKERISQGVAKLEERVSHEGDVKLEIDLLRKALEVERETGAFYKKMVEELPQEGRELFRPFLDVEDGHLALVQAEIDQLNGSGYWFDFREFDMV